MDLPERPLDREQRVAQGHGRMRQPAGVDDRRVEVALVEAVDQRTFVVRLAERDVEAQLRGARGDLGMYLVERGATVEGSVLLDGVKVGPRAIVRNAILDKNVIVPPGAEIGVDPVADEKRGFLVEDGLTVLGKDQQFPADS